VLPIKAPIKVYLVNLFLAHLLAIGLIALTICDDDSAASISHIKAKMDCLHKLRWIHGGPIAISIQVSASKKIFLQFQVKETKKPTKFLFVLKDINMYYSNIALAIVILYQLYFAEMRKGKAAFSLAPGQVVNNSTFSY
jgi:hypothetical protein